MISSLGVDLTLPRLPVPVFPLHGVFLFPHQVLPLHVFEPRYRQLVEDLLDGHGRFVIGTVPSRPMPAAAAGPGFLPVAGLGEIVRHERLPDGRFHIWVLGLGRVEIEEMPSDRLYRKVQCRPFLEVPPAAEEVEPLRERLLQATTARLQQPLPPGLPTPPDLLADLLAQTLGASLALLERYFAEPFVAARAELVLAAAAAAEPARKRRPRPDTEPPTEGDDGSLPGN